MKSFKIPAFLLLTITFYSVACSSLKSDKNILAYTYKPDDQKLHDTIVTLDSAFFQAYNTCNLNLEKYGAFYLDNIEFYHDKGGIMTSKKDIIEATEKNVCGKVTRELVKGSIEVYPIANYGAIEMGFHKFHNNTEKETTPARVGKFIIIWQYLNNEWKIARVVSLH